MVRLSRVAMALAFTTGSIALTATRATAVTCQVRNPDQSASYSSLNRAIREARRGDTLRIRGRCAGAFTVSKQLTLRGTAGAGDPTPTLAGKGDSPILTVVDKAVAVIDLRITGGHAAPASGIVNSGTLTLAGSTAIVRNGGTSSYGAILNSGTLIMLDQTKVKSNTGYSPAGISNSGTLQMWDSASVVGNTTPYGAGGIANTGTTDLHDSSSVTDNVAETDAAGGIMNVGGTLNLRDSSLVSGNSSANYGGGIFMDINPAGVINLYGTASVTNNSTGLAGGGIGVQFTSTATVNADPGWTGVISGNSPDDCYPSNVIPGCT